ncbi:MAG: molybdopterin-dependent oxidoreductase [Bryobacteraceae bacterium]|nr:molybdopterin-dependent oxidoreductase [Bryobacteraceae bacterium]
MVSTATTCPFCACGCGFFLLAKNGEAAGVAPGESHPVSAGKLCARGWCAHEAPSWGSRLLRPMIRRNRRLEPVPWNEALDHVAGRLRELIAAGKPVGVLGSARATNEENYLAGRLARAGLRTNHVDFCYHSQCRPLLAGIEDVTGGSTRPIALRDIESCDAVVLVEGDLAKTHPRAAASVLKARTRGARLIAIGCARTQMARVASRFLQVAPGSEGEAINALLAAALRAAGEEKQAARCAGYDALRGDLQAVSATDEIREAAEWIAAAERAAFLIGPSAGCGDASRKTAAVIATLAAVTGHLGGPGSGLLPLLGRSNARGACDVGLAPDRLPGYEPIEDGEARRRVESVWGKALPSGAGLDADRMIENVSGLVVLADDPAAVLSAGQRARAAIERIEFLVALDAFVTPVVEAAHAVLPVASFAETEGTVTNMEARIQRVRPAGPLPGDAVEGWRALAELSARLGAGGTWNSAADVFHEIERAAPRYGGTAARIFDGGWGSALTEMPEAVRFNVQAAATQELTTAERPFVLAWDGAFDWGGDPLVSFSPTLSRDSQSERKLFPNGFVEMSGDDADALGVRAGWQVKLGSARGEAIVPIRRRDGLRRGTLLAPYAFRDCLAGVLADEGITAVQVERA